MANTYNENTFLSTYRDDFKDSDHYHRILFNAGKALQARELTQLQTITQSEMARFGRNVFKEGGIVNGCQARITMAEYIRIDLTTGSYDDIENITTINAIIGKEFQGSTSGIKFRIVDVITSQNDDNPTIYVSYTDEGTSVASTSAPVRITLGEDITDTATGTYTFKVASANDINGNAHAGRGTFLSVNQGEVFCVGHFVFFKGSTLYLDKYNTDVNTNVGFKVIQDIVTVSDTTALYDNTGATPNLTAPGADRYRIRLSLTDQRNVSSDDIFVFFAKINQSKIVSQTAIDNSYNIVESQLAQRTKEESGNYIVDPFIINYTENDSDILAGRFQLNVSPGIAYVDGHRTELRDQLRLPVDIPNETDTVVTNVSANIGNYVEWDSASYFPDLNTFERVNLYDATLATGNVIGHARVRAIQEETPNNRAYLFDVKMVTDKNFRTVKSIGKTGGFFINAVTNQNGETLLRSSKDNDLFFNLPRARPTSGEGSDFTNISLTYQFQYTHAASSTSTGTVNVSTISPGVGTFTDTTSWVITDKARGVIAPTITLSGGNAVFNITGLINPHDISVTGYVTVASSALSYKTKEVISEGKVLDSAVTVGGVKYLPLGKTDIFKLKQTRYDSAGGDSTGDIFLLDNGQRDNFYDNGRLIIKEKFGTPTQDIYASFDYFKHVDSNEGGAFFSAASYPVGTGTNQIKYSEIPTHTLVNGNTVSLMGVLDFRSAVANGDSDYTKVTRIPKPTSTISGTVKYYKRRNDALIMNSSGVIEYIQGVDDVEPKFPQIPNAALPLYYIQMGANTISTNDMRIVKVDAPRYQMKDIDVIRKRVDMVENAVSLTMLELSTQNIRILDSADNERTRLGMFSDSFLTLDYSDTKNVDYAASINPQIGLLAPRQATYGMTLKYDSDNYSALNSNVVRKGDSLYLAYTNKAYQSQLKASRTENINPFGLVCETPRPRQINGGSWYIIVGDQIHEVDSAGADPRDVLAAYPSVTSPPDIACPAEPIPPAPLVGIMQLSPSRDTWIITKNAKKIITSSTTLDTDLDLDYLQDEYQWNWHGITDVSSLSANDKLGESRSIETIATARIQVGVNFSEEDDEGEGGWWWTDTWNESVSVEAVHTKQLTVTGINTVTKNLGNTTVQVGVLPWMRQRLVFYKAEGLQPNTTHYPFINGKRIDAFIRRDTNGFKKVSSVADDDALYIEDYGTLTAHPSGSNVLKSDANGTIEGTFLIPGGLTADGVTVNPNFRLRAGSAQLLLTDVQNSLVARARSHSVGNYSCSGVINEVTQREHQTTTISIGESISSSGFRINDDNINDDLTNRGRRTLFELAEQYNIAGYSLPTYVDPLAQSFYVNETGGVYITKIGVFFKTAPAAADQQTPVRLELRPTVNGYPSSSTVLAFTSKTAAEVRAVADTRASLDAMRANPCDFEFDEPIYLKGKQWYSFALLAGDSIKYEIYTAKMGESELGTTDTSISRQPTMGSMFKSQNGSTWEADQLSDIAYVLTRAEFTTSGTAVLENRKVPRMALPNNPFQFTSSSAKVKVYAPDHGLAPGDTTTIYGITGATVFNGVAGFNIAGAKTVDSAEIDYFSFTTDSADVANQSGFGGSSGVSIDQNYSYNTVMPVITSVLPDHTTMKLSGQFTKGYSYGEGGAYTKDTTFRTLENGANQSFNADPYPRVMANRGLEITKSAIYGGRTAANGRSTSIKIDLTTANKLVSPKIDLSTPQLTLAHWLIDQQDSASGNSFNVPIKFPSANFVPETLARGGSSYAKHITLPIRLAVAARGVKVIAGVNKPSGATIDLYYRIATDNNINDVDWLKIAPTNNHGVDDVKTVYRDYNYLIGGDQGLATSFSQFQLKMVLNASNSSKYPTVTDLRAIAVF